MGNKNIGPSSRGYEFGRQPVETEKKGELQGKEVDTADLENTSAEVGTLAKTAFSDLEETKAEGAVLKGRVARELSAEEKTRELLSLIAEDQRDEICPQLERTVKFIQENRKLLSEKLKGQEPATYYFRAKKEGLTENGIFNIQISRDAQGREVIFILPKTEKLGSGTYKVVRAGLNYTDNQRVACATIKDENGIKEAHEEFQLQKQLGVSDFSCTYELVKGEKIQEKMLILMPVANQGDMNIWVNSHSIGDLDSNQMKQIAVSFCDFLSMFEEAGIVMSDVKPSNTLLHKEGEGFSVLINDVGFAYKKDDPEAYLFAGTHEFIAPEVLRARLEEIELDQLVEVYEEISNDLASLKEDSAMYRKALSQREEIEAKIIRLSEEGVAKTVGYPRDAYAAGITLALFYAGRFPPWIVNSMNPVGDHLMIDPDRYPGNYEEWGKTWPEEGLSPPDLEYIIFRMTDPDPKTRWSITKTKEALENMSADWRRDPLIKANMSGKEIWP